jgi:RHS repeat-associated protein
MRAGGQKERVAVSGMRWSALWLLCCAVLLSLTAQAFAAQDGFSATGESPQVADILSHLSQGSGPLVSPQGGSGSNMSPPGELRPSLSTAFSNTYEPKTGPRVTRIYAAPVNYKGAEGSWHPISNQLVPSALGGYENEANSFSLHIPNSLSTGMSLMAGISSLSFALQGAREAMPAVSGTQARFSEALTATDFEYESLATGVKETATLKGPSAPEALRFSLVASPNLSVRTASNGTVELVDTLGAVVFRIPVPLAYRPGEDAGAAHALPVSLSQVGATWVLRIDTSEAWLRSELAAGPVEVDPTVEVGASGNCFIENDEPSVSFCSQSYFDVGYGAKSEVPLHEHHGLLQFSLGSLPLAANVLNAKLALYLEEKSTANAKPIGVYRVIKPWTTSATWERYDGVHAWATPGGDYANPSENSDAAVNPAVGASTGWYFWYPTRMMQEWVNGTNAPAGEGYANEGLIVKDVTENAINNDLTFASTRSGSNQPYLEVSYEPRGLGQEQQYTLSSTPLSDRSAMSVNVASGDLILQGSDLAIAGVAGLDFTSTRTWNSLNSEEQQYGRWTDSNGVPLSLFSDGSVAYEDPSGAWFAFVKKPDGSFVVPPGIKATICVVGSPAPCPQSLPAGVSYRLSYEGSEDHIDFNSSGVRLDMQDRFKNTISREVPSSERQLYSDTHGHQIEELSTEAGFLTEVKDLSGARATKYTYSGTGAAARLEKYIDAIGKATTYAYDGSGNLLSITDPRANVTKFTYDSRSRVTEIIRTTNAEHTTGPTVLFLYFDTSKAPGKYCTSAQQATIVRDPDWKKPLKEEEGDKFKLAAHETLYCANVLDEVERTFDANGNETTSTYDPVGNMTSATAPARETGASRGVTSFIYGTGGQNLLCEVEGTTGAPLTECPATALEHGYTVAAKYQDETYVFQPTGIISARQKMNNICYWEGTHACEGTGGTGGAGTNGALRQQSNLFVSQNAVNFSYNPNGTVSTSEDADEHRTSYEYDASGNLKTVIAPVGSHLAKKTISVDADGRPHIITQCLAESGGSCTSSETETLTYDNLDRITEAVDSGPGAPKTFRYTFDGDGNLTKRVDPGGTTSFTIDKLNRVTKESLPGAVSNSYTYDAASNITNFTDSGGKTHYSYNGLNELESMYEPEGNCGLAPSNCSRLSYDNDGSLRQITYPSKATLNYQLDATTGRPQAVSAKSPTGETLISNSYTYLDGTHDTPRIFGRTTFAAGSGTDTASYEYDLLDRLINATTEGSHPSHYEYVLDGAGNRLSQKVNPTGSTGGTEVFFGNNTGNELECRMKTNEPCSNSSTTEISGYSYDGAGNETQITPYSDNERTEFRYNNLNQLDGLVPPFKNLLTLGYIGGGQTNLTSIGPTITLQNSHLGLTVQSSQTGSSYYARMPSGLMVDERLAGGIDYSPVYDAQGDVVGLLNTSGELVQSIRYGPYGENTQATGLAYSATTDPFLFQGGYHMEGGNAGNGNVPNGLYHFGERYYDPTTGRWTQSDPLGESSEYGFTGDDPINEADPTGCVRARTPLTRWAEHECDVKREKEPPARKAQIGNFNGGEHVEQAIEKRAIWSVQLEYKPEAGLDIPLASLSGPFAPAMWCHVVVGRRNGHFFAVKEAHFRHYKTEPIA